MQVNDACSALNNKRCVKIRYSGLDRVIEIHAVGYTRDNKPVMRAWQARGGSSSGGTAGWKLFRLEEVEVSEIIDEGFENTREGYRRSDPAIHRIVCEL